MPLSPASSLSSFPCPQLHLYICSFFVFVLYLMIFQTVKIHLFIFFFFQEIKVEGKLFACLNFLNNTEYL